MTPSWLAKERHRGIDAWIPRGCSKPAWVAATRAPARRVLRWDRRPASRSRASPSPTGTTAWGSRSRCPSPRRPASRLKASPERIISGSRATIIIATTTRSRDTSRTFSASVNRRDTVPWDCPTLSASLTSTGNTIRRPWCRRRRHRRSRPDVPPRIDRSVRSPTVTSRACRTSIGTPPTVGCRRSPTTASCRSTISASTPATFNTSTPECRTRASGPPCARRTAIIIIITCILLIIRTTAPTAEAATIIRPGSASGAALRSAVCTRRCP